MRNNARFCAGLWLALLTSCTRSTGHLYGTGEEPNEGEAEAEAESEAESEAEAESEGDADGGADAGRDGSSPRMDGGMDPDAPRDAGSPTEDASPDAGPDTEVPTPEDAATPNPDAAPVGPDASVPDEFPLCPATNWLTNPGFEDPIGETWVDTGPGGTLTRDCAVAYEGACSARLETDGVSGGEVQLRQSSIPTVSGSTEICFFARANREVRVELEVASPASERFGTVMIGTEWEGVCTPRDIAEESELRIVLDNPAIPQTVWFDAVFFGPTTCP